jgi:hypothetical protein
MTATSMKMTSYEKRVLRELENSMKTAHQMLERESDTRTEFMARVAAIRNQLLQAASAASELFRAMSAQEYNARGDDK